MLYSHKNRKRIILRYMNLNEPAMKPWLTKDQYEQKIQDYKELLRDRDNRINQYRSELGERDRRQMRMEIEARRMQDIRSEDNRPGLLHVFAFLGLLLSIHYTHLELQKYWIEYNKEQVQRVQKMEAKKKELEIINVKTKEK